MEKLGKSCGQAGMHEFQFTVGEIALLSHLSESCLTKMSAMKDHADINERQRWNAFKCQYRKSHPTKTRNNQYYEHIRKLYRDQDKPNLEPWLNMSSHSVPVTEQELIDQAQEAQNRMIQEMGDSYQNIRQLRDYLEYLRHVANCPPHVIAGIQQEIFKLTLI